VVSCEKEKALLLSSKMRAKDWPLGLATWRRLVKSSGKGEGLQAKTIIVGALLQNGPKNGEIADWKGEVKGVVEISTGQGKV
jgi:hypothetical protein